MRLKNWFITNPYTSQQEELKVFINQKLIEKGVANSDKTNMVIYSTNQADDNMLVIVIYIALKINNQVVKNHIIKLCDSLITYNVFYY
jgi:hypothetical protein